MPSHPQGFTSAFGAAISQATNPISAIALAPATNEGNPRIAEQMWRELVAIYMLPESSTGPLRCHGNCALLPKDIHWHPWEPVHNYHGTFLGMMEQNELTWTIPWSRSCSFSIPDSSPLLVQHTKHSYRPLATHSAHHISLEHARTIIIMDPRCPTSMPGAFGYGTRHVITQNQAVPPKPSRS